MGSVMSFNVSRNMKNPQPEISIEISIRIHRISTTPKTLVLSDSAPICSFPDLCSVSVLFGRKRERENEGPHHGRDGSEQSIEKALGKKTALADVGFNSSLRPSEAEGSCTT